MFMYMGVIFLMAAFGLAGGAVWAWFKGQRTMEARVAAAGTVVELVSRVTASGRASMYCPVVEFSIPSGEHIRFTSEFGSLPASHTVGQSVKVRYDPADPRQAEIESGTTRWLGPLVFGFMAVIACCLGTVFLGIYALVPSSFGP